MPLLPSEGGGRSGCLPRRADSIQLWSGVLRERSRSGFRALSASGAPVAKEKWPKSTRHFGLFSDGEGTNLP